MKLSLDGAFSFRVSGSFFSFSVGGGFSADFEKVRLKIPRAVLVIFSHLELGKPSFLPWPDLQGGVVNMPGGSRASGPRV